jgi:hypothetical protein
MHTSTTSTYVVLYRRLGLSPDRCGVGIPRAVSDLTFSDIGGIYSYNFNFSYVFDLYFDLFGSMYMGELFIGVWFVHVAER